jgi:hypothetical protein
MDFLYPPKPVNLGPDLFSVRVIVKLWLWLGVLIILIVGLAACSDESAPAEGPPDLSGPALIMFYTDN